MTAVIRIARAVAIHPDAAGGPSIETLMVPERRARKVGALPDKARLVLAAARRCLPPDGARPMAAPMATYGGAAGVSLGTCHGSQDVAEQCLEAVRCHGFAGVTPSWYASGLPNATAAIVASLHDLTGPNLTALGYAAGIEAIILACRQIRAGRAAAMLAGGFDVASPRATARFAASPEYAGARAIHPGVGLVWLEPAGGADGDADDGAAATVAGWSQSVRDDGEDAAAFSARLVAAATGGDARRPVVHVIGPGRADRVDHLAATAPIHLVETILERGPPGLHALMVQGFGPGGVCLAVDVPPR